LWQVLCGMQRGRTSDAQISMFDSVGFALEDFSALRFVRDAAMPLGLGQSLDVIPQLPDPKNLYQLIRPSKAQPTTAPRAVVALDPA
jgi:ornithine cyclodeaminase